MIKIRLVELIRYITTSIFYASHLPQLTLGLFVVQKTVTTTKYKKKYLRSYIAPNQRCK